MATPPIRPPTQQALSVTPISSMPYIPPLGSYGNDNSMQVQEDPKPTENDRPALLCFPAPPTKEELNELLSSTKGGIALSGTALEGTVGPVLGKRDIGESQDFYVFRVCLPGVAREEFKCNATPDGQILIKGITKTGEKVVYKNSMRFEMQSQNLCPPGHFTISFKLPGPVDCDHFTADFGLDGIFEGKVKKRILAN